jgi:RES domain-containing protein
MAFTTEGSRPHGKVVSLTVWRLDKQKYVDNDSCCSGNGAAISPGRWNGKDKKVLYTASNIALAFLEFYINIDPIKIQEGTFQPRIVQIYLDGLSYEEVSISELPNKWRIREEPTDPTYLTTLQRLGLEWLQMLKTPILKVPSAVIPNEFNYLINPDHPDIKDRLSWKSPSNGQSKVGGVFVRILDNPLEFDQRFIDLKNRSI